VVLAFLLRHGLCQTAACRWHVSAVPLRRLRPGFDLTSSGPSSRRFYRGNFQAGWTSFLPPSPITLNPGWCIRLDLLQDGLICLIKRVVDALTSQGIHLRFAERYRSPAATAGEMLNSKNYSPPRAGSAFGSALSCGP
jgi:hypothetical protein